MRVERELNRGRGEGETGDRRPETGDRRPEIRSKATQSREAGPEIEAKRRFRETE